LALLATLPTLCPALLALSPTPPTALRTASAGLEPLSEPLLERDPFAPWDFANEPDDFELDDLGFAFFADPRFADLGFAAFGFAFDFDCDLAFGFDRDLGFDFIDEPALFDADRFFVLVSAIFLSPRVVSL
jgi:hypothetical protein